MWKLLGLAGKSTKKYQNKRGGEPYVKQRLYVSAFVLDKSAYTKKFSEVQEKNLWLMFELMKVPPQNECTVVKFASKCVSYLVSTLGTHQNTHHLKQRHMDEDE